ncbi:MAG: hypothetical protein KJ799_18470 [Bacteroidetes bacterium]|nr:hypothetical protein [Bacteroidota bacterium]
MNYYIGLDGGGTKTACILADENLNPIYECSGGPSNFLIRGTEEVSNTILNLINESLEKSSINLDNVKGIVIGTTGAGRRADAEKLENDFLRIAGDRGFSIKNFRVESDARIALEGAFLGKPGSILIAGTGSIMFGKDSNGNIHRVGGFGRFLGDEGSGYSLGRKGLTAVSKFYDGRSEKTMLADLIKEEFNIFDSASLITEVYQKSFDISKIAPLVIQCAESGCELCTKIVNEEVDELLLHVKAMHKKLEEDILMLSLIGGTITTKNYYAEKFRLMVEELGNVNIINAELPPALGAALMAKLYF